MSQGGSPPPFPPAESSLPSAMTSHSVTMNHPVATTPVTTRINSVRLHFFLSDDETDEAIYDAMSNENDDRNAQIRQIVLDTIRLPW
jgi:hypothetical protein